MVKNLGGKSFLCRFRYRFNLFGTRSYCSSPQNKNTNNNALVPINSNNAIAESSNNAIVESSNDGSSSSLSTYDEQYKALSDLDFMTATRMVFNEQKEKEFGWDFHMVQCFFACLPSLAVYLIAQYSRSEMRRMDAELEVKKQAEFEAHAKKMERKQRSAMASNPELLEVKERLGKIEEAVKQIIDDSKRKSSNHQSDGNKPQAAQVKLDINLDKPEASKTSVASTRATGTRGSSDDEKVTKNGVPSQDAKK